MYFLYYYMYLFIIVYMATEIVNNYLNIDTYYFIDCKFTADIKLCVHLYMSA